MKFLKNSKIIVEKIKGIINDHTSEEPIKIAVAFWGDGASTLLQGNKQFSVICNLCMGGTNPTEIERIMSLPNVTIIQNDNLHAKVVLSSAGAIVSSANFSSSALPLNENQFQGWREAGIYLNNSSTELSEIDSWFSAIKQVSKKITIEDIAKAQDAWDKRIKVSPQETQPTLNAISTKKTALSTPLIEKRICSLNNPGSGSPLFLRSASAIIALKGERGDPMPLNAFIFLFSGNNGRAFITHKDKFKVDYLNQTVKIKADCIGYFVGDDGKMEAVTDKKRRKVATDVVYALANWMLNNGTKPEEAKGSITCDAFQVK